MFLAVFMCLCGLFYPAFGTAHYNPKLPTNLVTTYRRNDINRTNVDILSREVRSSDPLISDISKNASDDDLPNRKFYQQVLVTTITKSQFNDDLELFSTANLIKMMKLLRKYLETNEGHSKIRNLNKILNLFLYYAQKSENGDYWYSRIINEPRNKAEVYIRDLLNQQWLRQIFIMVVQNEYDFDVINRPSPASVYLQNWSEPQHLFTVTKITKPKVVVDTQFVIQDNQQNPVNVEKLPVIDTHFPQVIDNSNIWHGWYEENINLLRTERLIHILEIIKRQELQVQDVVRLHILQKVKRIVSLLIIVARGKENWHRQVSQNPQNSLQAYVQTLLKHQRLYRILMEIETSGNLSTFYSKPDLVEFTMSVQLPVEILKIIETHDVYNNKKYVTDENLPTDSTDTPRTWPGGYEENINQLRIERLSRILQIIQRQERDVQDDEYLRVLQKVKQIVSLLIIVARGNDNWHREVLQNPRNNLQVFVQTLLKHQRLYRILNEIENSGNLFGIYRYPELVEFTVSIELPIEVLKIVETHDVYNNNKHVTVNPVTVENLPGTDSTDTPRTWPGGYEENINQFRSDRLIRILEIIKRQEVQVQNVIHIHILKKLKKIVSLLIIVARGNENWQKEVLENPKNNLHLYAQSLLKHQRLYRILNDIENSGNQFSLHRKPELVEFIMTVELPVEVTKIIETSEDYNNNEYVPQNQVPIENLPVTDSTVTPNMWHGGYEENINQLRTERLIRILESIKRQELEVPDVSHLRILQKVKKFVFLLFIVARGNDNWQKEVLENPKNNLQLYVQSLLKHQRLYRILNEIEKSGNQFALHRKPELVEFIKTVELPVEVTKIIESSDAYNNKNYLKHYPVKVDILPVTDIQVDQNTYKPNIWNGGYEENINQLRTERLLRIFDVIKRQELEVQDVAHLRILQKLKKFVSLLIIVARGSENWQKQVLENPQNNLQVHAQRLLKHERLYRILNELENSGKKFVLHRKPELVEFTMSFELPNEVLKIVDTSDVYNLENYLRDHQKIVEELPVIDSHAEQVTDTSNLLNGDSEDNFPNSIQENILKVERLVNILLLIKHHEAIETDSVKLSVLQNVKKLVSLLLIVAESGDKNWYKEVMVNPKNNSEVYVQQLLKQKWLYNLLLEIEKSENLQILHRKPDLFQSITYSKFPSDVMKVIEISDLYKNSYDVPYNPDTENINNENIEIIEKDVNYPQDVDGNVPNPNKIISNEPYEEHSYPNLPQNDNNGDLEIDYNNNYDDHTANLDYFNHGDGDHTQNNAFIRHTKQIYDNQGRPQEFNDIIDIVERTTIETITSNNNYIKENDFIISIEQDNKEEIAIKPNDLAEKNNKMLRKAIIQLRKYKKGEDNRLPDTMKLFKANNLIIILHKLTKIQHKTVTHLKVMGVILELLHAASTIMDKKDWYSTLIKYPKTRIENNAKTLLLDERLHTIMFVLVYNNYDLSVIDRPPLNAIISSWKLPTLSVPESSDNNRPEKPSPDYLLTTTNLLEILKALKDKLATLPKDEALLNLEKILTVFLISAFKAKDNSNWYQAIIERPKDILEQDIQKTLTQEQLIHVLIDLYKTNNNFENLLQSNQVKYLQTVTIPNIRVIEDDDYELTTQSYIPEINTSRVKPIIHEVFGIESLNKIWKILEIGENVRIPLHLRQKLQYIITILLTVAEKSNSGDYWHSKTINNPENELENYARLLLQQEWLETFLIELQDSIFEMKSIRNIVLIQRLQQWRFPQNILKILPPTSRIIGITITESDEDTESEETENLTPVQDHIKFIIRILKTELDDKASEVVLKQKLYLWLYMKKALQKIAIYLKSKGYSAITIVNVLRKLNSELKTHRTTCPPSNHAFYDHAEEIITPILNLSK